MEEEHCVLSNGFWPTFLMKGNFLQTPLCFLNPKGRNFCKGWAGGKKEGGQRVVTFW